MPQTRTLIVRQRNMPTYLKTGRTLSRRTHESKPYQSHAVSQYELKRRITARMDKNMLLSYFSFRSSKTK